MFLGGLPMLLKEQLTGQVISAAIKVHKALGPGLLESAYETCLAHELLQRGIECRRQVEDPIVYVGCRLSSGFRIDLLVQEEVIVELKAIEKLAPIHEGQLMTYLRLSGKKVGLLVNFNTLRLTNGIVRRVL